MATETETISRIRQIYYDTYANLPTSSVTLGDLGYATDRKTLYRWSGAAWQAITIYSASGLAGAIPAAGDLPNGSIYFETDTGTLKQVQAGAWVILPTGSAYYELFTAPYNPAGTLAWEDYDISALVPVGTKTVEVYCYGTSAGTRKNGSALGRSLSGHVYHCEVDSNRIIEVWSHAPGASGYILMGYWK
jgi:hypothetical protein